MLSKEHKFMLMAASESKKTEVIDKAIAKVKQLSPENFLTEEEMQNRVFVHMPYGPHWSGSYKTVEKIPTYIFILKK
jgi:hypothetical protein